MAVRDVALIDENHYRSFKKRGGDENLGNYVADHIEPQSSSSTSGTSHHDVLQEDIDADPYYSGLQGSNQEQKFSVCLLASSSALLLTQAADGSGQVVVR